MFVIYLINMSVEIKTVIFLTEYKTIKFVKKFPNFNLIIPCIKQNIKIIY